MIVQHYFRKMVLLPVYYILSKISSVRTVSRLVRVDARNRVSEFSETGVSIPVCSEDFSHQEEGLKSSLRTYFIVTVQADTIFSLKIAVTTNCSLQSPKNFINRNRPQLTRSTSPNIQTIRLNLLRTHNTHHRNFILLSIAN